MGSAFNTVCVKLFCTKLLMGTVKKATQAAGRLFFINAVSTRIRFEHGSQGGRGRRCKADQNRTTIRTLGLLALD